jgi:hypothetical protein
MQTLEDKRAGEMRLLKSEASYRRRNKNNEKLHAYIIFNKICIERAFEINCKQKMLIHDLLYICRVQK